MSNDPSRLERFYTWLNGLYLFVNTQTERKKEDNLWQIGLKFFFKGVAIFILILMSPIILFIIGMAFFMAL